MSAFQPIPFEDLIRRVFYEYKTYGKIFGVTQDKFFQPLPGVNLAVNYMGRRASTPFGPAAGPHTQLAQNLVLAWLTGSRILELKTVQLLDTLELSRPCIDTENLGFNVEWSQELRLEESLREYVKAWMLIEMIKSCELLGEEHAKKASDTIFDLSIGYDFKGIKSEKMFVFIQALKQADHIIDALRTEIPPEFSRFRDMDYPSRIIDSVTLSTFHGCPADEIDHIASYLLTEHQVNVIVKLNPTLLGQEHIQHILRDVLGYQDLVLHPEAFDHDLTFDQAIQLTRDMLRTAKSCGKRLGVKLTNTLVVKNHKGYFPDDVMYLSGPPLHVLALNLLKTFRNTLGTLETRVFTSFSAGVDAKNIADVLSLNLVPVTVCTDMLKVPGYEKSLGYLQKLADKIDETGAITLPDYVVKRFDHAVSAIEDVFTALRERVARTNNPHAEAQTQIFDTLQKRVLQALKENNDSLELLTTDALIVTKTLGSYHQRYSDIASMPRSFKELYDMIVAAAAHRNLDSLLYQTMLDPRYSAEKNTKVPKKLPGKLQPYDCTNCGRCITICPNTANFAYYVKPGQVSYENYQLTEYGLQKIEGGTFTLEKFYQVANFDDCCNQCSLCGIHCVETGKPYEVKPKYFGSRERWEASPHDGFVIEKTSEHDKILGRIAGKTYSLTYETKAQQFLFDDGVITGVFDVAQHTLLKTVKMDTRKLGHTVDMRNYHILLTQLYGVLNQENCNYVNIKYFYEYRKELLDIRGILPVLNTPFTTENQIDLWALSKHVQQAMTAGAAGFIVPAMTGGGPTWDVDALTDEERFEVVHTVLDEVKHRIPVVGGVFAPTHEGRLRQSKKLIELGCNGILVHVPYVDDQQYLREVREIAALDPGFLILQDWDRHGFGVPVPVIQQLFYELESFKGLTIDVRPAGVKYTQVLRATKGDLHISGGWAMLEMLEALDRGVHAFMPTGMTEIYTNVYNFYQEGQPEAARELFEQVLPALVFANQHQDIAIQFFKRLLYKQGLYATPHVRNPQFPFDAHHEALADALIGRIQTITATLQP